MSNRRVGHVFDCLADDHAAFLASGADRFYQEVLWQHFIPHLSAKIPSHILDVGGGTGLWASRFAQQGHRVIVVDLSFRMLNHVDGQDAIWRCQADVDNLPFPSSCFDLILAVGDLLNYVPDPTTTLEKLSDVSKPDASLIIIAASRWGMLLHQIQRLDDFRLLSDPVFQERTAIELSCLDTSNTDEGLCLSTLEAQNVAGLLKNLGWEIQAVFPVGVLATIWGQKKLATKLGSEGYAELLKHEYSLCQVPVYQNITKEFGIIAQRS